MTIAFTIKVRRIWIQRHRRDPGKGSGMAKAKTGVKLPPAMDKARQESFTRDI